MGFRLLHLHHHHHDQDLKIIPKGCMPVLVGQVEEEELQRFIVPVRYMYHPLFVELLKEAEEEYGFSYKGPLTLPCPVEHFRSVQVLIDKERHLLPVVNDRYHHHHHHHFLCFKA